MSPGLMQYSDVVTFFHEFGHLMHAILGGQQRWAGVSGIATEGDFVEVPSQMLEEFFRDAGLLASFAKHYQTGEPIPAELVEKMNRAGAFGRADWVRTQHTAPATTLDTHYPERTNRKQARSRHSLLQGHYPISALYVDRWQPHVCQLYASDRILIELLHLSL